MIKTGGAADKLQPLLSFWAEMRGSPLFFRVCEKNMKKSNKPLEISRTIRYTEKAVT